MILKRINMKNSFYIHIPLYNHGACPSDRENGFCPCTTLIFPIGVSFFKRRLFKSQIDGTWFKLIEDDDKTNANVKFEGKNRQTREAELELKMSSTVKIFY